MFLGRQISGGKGTLKFLTEFYKTMWHRLVTIGQATSDAAKKEDPKSKLQR